MTKSERLTLEIEGMTCDSCVVAVESALRGVAGVEEAAVTLQPGRAVVRGRDLRAERLQGAVRSAGYSARVPDAPSPAPALRERPAGPSGPRDADLIVVGGGSAGFAAAIRGQELGARVVLVNDGALGGTCVNVGCVPSKTLIRAAQAHHGAAHNRFAGIESTSRVADFSAVVEQKNELVASLRQSKYVDVLAAYENVELVEGRAVLRAPDTVEVAGRVIRAASVVVTTGSQPWIPPVPGLRESAPLTSTSAFALKRLPASMLVLGGRYVALECAQIFARLGSRVTVLQRSDHVLPTEDDDLTDALVGYLRDEGVQVELGAELLEVSRNAEGVTVSAKVGGRTRAFEAERVLSATGRRPVTRGFGLEEVGVRLGADGRVEVDERLRTSVPSVYAAGDAVGEPAFVYTAGYEGNLAAENALDGDARERDYTALPWVVFTDPQVAGVGLNETEAAAAGVEVEVSHLDLSHVPRALAARDTRGFIKLLKRRGTDELVGARVLAPEGGEQIMEAALAIRHGIGVSELARAFHPYLTQAEGVKLCALGFTKDVGKLSCCSE